MATHEVVVVPAAPEHIHYSNTAVALLESAGTGDGLSLRTVSADQPPQEDAQRVVVAPSTARGLADASAMISTWRPDLPRPVLLVVRDAPLPPPPIVVQRTRALAQRCHFSAEIPYLPHLRMLEEPERVWDLPGRAVTRTRRSLRHLRRHLYVAGAFLSHTPPAGIPDPPLDLDTPDSAVPVPEYQTTC